jgi:hypothetical protein
MKSVVEFLRNYPCDLVEISEYPLGLVRHVFPALNERLYMGWKFDRVSFAGRREESLFIYGELLASTCNDFDAK